MSNTKAGAFGNGEADRQAFSNGRIKQMFYRVWLGREVFQERTPGPCHKSRLSASSL